MPLYNLIDQNFRELILSGQLKPGDAIPSEWDLATVYGVSRLTVRHALDNLACQGWLSRRHGVGTFIANPTITPIAPSNLSFSEQLRAVGRRPSSRLVSIQVIPAGCEVAGHLRLQESEPVVEITRLRLADDEPILIETSYLSRSRFPGLENATELASGSLNGYLVTHYQVHVVEMDQTLEPVILSESEARYLETPTGSLAVLSEVIAYTNNGDPIEYCWSLTVAISVNFISISTEVKMHSKTKKQKIAFLPLDDRPVNYDYPGYLARAAGWKLLIPPREWLGNPWRVSQHARLVDWVAQAAQSADAMIIAIDTLAYGGMIPSRTSREALDYVLERLVVLRQVKSKRANMPILAFNVVQRISRHNSSEEEKNYWAYYGSDMFRLSYLEHKVALGDASPAEISESAILRAMIPQQVGEDYRQGRSRNHAVNQAMLDWLAEGCSITF